MKLQRLRKMAAVLLCVASVDFAAGQTPDALRDGWASPPEATKPHVYWYWLNNVITLDGITRDLEAMAKNGIGGAYVGHLGFFGTRGDTPQNQTTEPLSEAWYGQLQHAVREAKRTGVKFGIFNGPGWSQSGGPWVKPEESMARIVSAEVRVTGGRRFDDVLPRVKGAIVDVRVVAFPVPLGEGQTFKAARVTSDDGDNAFAALADGAAHTLPADKSYPLLRLTFAFDSPQIVRSIAFRHTSGKKVTGRLLTSTDGQRFEPLREFTLDRRSGPVTQVQARSAPSTVAVPTTTATFFRIEMPWSTKAGENGKTLGVAFSPAARVELTEEKQLNIANRSITPPWDAYVFPPAPETDAAATVSPGTVLDLTERVAPDGRLTWDAPAGEWVVQRFSTVSTGAGNGPAPKAMSGLEIDKMSRKAAANHIAQGPVGQLWNRLTPAEREGFHYAIGDSYEKGPQNWTPGLEREFKTRLGYDPVPFLPVLGGRVVGSATQSDRFLWDLRRLVADLVAENYVGGLRDAIRPLGLKLWLENYGHFGFPAEFLSYGGQADAIGGEFWLNKPISSMEMRGAAAAAHTYGQPLVSAEAFTSAGSQSEKPGDLKTRGDYAFAQGINHYVLHVVSHQPTEVPGPGMQLLWGTYFHRKSLWFAEHGKAWVDYVRRTSYLLQQGRPMADVAYYIGEDVPQMTGILQPALPPGYDYDFINAEVLLTRASVKDGRLVLPDGVSYAVLALPPTTAMRPRVIERIGEFVKQGLNVVGPMPTRSPSLQNFPKADERVRAAAAELWPAGDQRDRKIGLGRVWADAALADVLTGLGVGPAVEESNPSVLWKHRSTDDADIFFLSNQTAHELQIAPSFRVSGRSPQLWNAETTTIESPAVYRQANGRTVVPLTLASEQAVFVVFRRATAPPPAVVDVLHNDRPAHAWTEPKADAADESADTNLSHAFWVKPAGDIRLPEQKATGNEMRGQRWVVLPPRGETIRGEGFATRGPDYAITGVSVGRNGVAAFQRSADGAPAVLVWKAPEPLADWTHVVVAYRAGVPHLYVNSKEVHRGVRTGRRLLAGDDSTAEGNDSGSPFERQVREFRTLWKPLDPATIAAMTSNFDSHPVAVQVLRTEDGSLRLRTTKAGRYTLRLDDGQTLTADVAEPPAAELIDGPWAITFDGPAAPAAARWDTLKSWSTSDDEATKYFSGSATYTATVDLPAGFDAARVRTVLDLGRVAHVARVDINGQAVGTALREPYHLDVTHALKPGTNTLRVHVTSDWSNRMIGDEQFPDDLADARAENGNLNRWPDWAFTGQPRPEPRRITLSARKVFEKTSPLHTAGLIGPVTLHFQNETSVQP